MVTNPTPPPSIEALRDELCVKLIGETALISSNDETIDDYLRMNAIKGFEVGWSAALQELSRRAEGEFDVEAAKEAFIDYALEFHDPNECSQECYVEGRRDQHARDFARIQQLEAEASRLRAALELIAESYAEDSGPDGAYTIAREALSGQARGEGE